MRFHGTLGLILALAMGAFPARAGTSLPQLQRASSFCIKAERAIRCGNLHSARANFTRAIQIAPELPAAHMGMGHIALAERRFQDALREYELAKSSYAGFAEELLALRMEDYADSKQKLAALEDEIRNEQRLFYSPLRISRLERAVESLARRAPPSREAIEDPPAEVDFYIGNALFHLGRLPDAISSWRASIEKNRTFSQAYQNLAVGYWLSGDVGDAVRTLGEAAKFGLSVDPNLRADLLAAASPGPGAAGPTTRR